MIPATTESCRRSVFEWLQTLCGIWTCLQLVAGTCVATFTPEGAVGQDAAHSARNRSICPTVKPSHSEVIKSNVWNGLSWETATNVADWLYDQIDLNLTEYNKAGDWDNKITLIELMPPNKSHALAYIDGSGSLPTQYAHVVLDIRATQEPTYTDVLVGPLPVGDDTTWRPLEYPYTRKTGGRVRNLETDFTAKNAFIMSIADSIADITMDLWNGFAKGQDNDTLDVWGVDSWQEGERVFSWLTFWNKGTDEYDGGSILPLGLCFKVDLTGRDASHWTLEGWLYNDIFYNTTAEFRTSFYSVDFVRLPPHIDGDWASTNRRGEPLPMDNLAAPTIVTPGGARYSVDLEAKYIQWMDFSFYISFTRDRGLALFDVRYRGERILYELGLQEALSHYAGNDPVQSGSGYLDSHYGIGSLAYPLVAGYDCPLHASYMNTSMFMNGKMKNQINSICLFEYDADFPLQRHSTSKHYSGTKNVFFVVRFISTVANYDYLFSYHFHLDGSIKVEVRASGYIQPAFFAHNSEYGYKIHDALSGSMHDHVLNFKADFDILGTANTVELVSSIPVSRPYTWSSNIRNTMKLWRRYLSTEDESQLLWDGNAATQYKIVNRAAPNKYGEHRGYRIVPGSPGNHLTVQNSSVLHSAANWASHDLYITQYHDTEPRSTHPYNDQDVLNPPIDFAKFFNSESIDQEDLVVWFNLGMHHLPHSGDVPNTVSTAAHSSVLFLPVNFFEEGDMSRRTRSQVRIDYGTGDVSQIELFGQAMPSCAADFEVESEELMDVFRNYTRGK